MPQHNSAFSQHGRQFAAHVIFLGLTALVSFMLSGCKRDFPSYPPTYREYAYVANGASNTVTVIDAVNFRVVKTIHVGISPASIAVNSKKNEVYVANSESNNISVIDSETNTVTAVIGVQRSPHSIDVSRDGARAYVANSGSNNISVIDLGQRKVIATIKVGAGPEVVRISSDGGSAIVSERMGNSVSIVDTSSSSVRARFPICTTPTDVAILPDSSKAFLACEGSMQIAAVALKTQRHDPSSAAFDEDRLLALLEVGRRPVHLALKPDGGELFVSNFDGNTFSEVATGSNEVGGSYLVGTHPVRGVVSADNTLLYVSNVGSDNVAVYMIDTGKLLKSVPVGAGPQAMAFSQNQNFLFVVDGGSGDVAVIRTTPLVAAARSGDISSIRAEIPLLTIIPVGAQPNAIAIKAFLSRAPAS